MVWVYIALSIPVLILLLLHFLRFHFSIDVQTPASLRGSVGVSFMGFRREISVDAGRAFTAQEGENGDEDENGEPAPQSSGQDGSGTGPASDKGQRGALSIPDSWLGYFSRLKVRLQKAFIKWALDFSVWRLLVRFTLKSGKRVFGLLQPGLKSLHLGMEDVYDLGRIAAAWSVVSGTVPALNCPVQFGFTEPFNFQAKLAGGFTGLNTLIFGLLTVFSFPWIPLGTRFVHCWRDPRLSRWQRRVLLP
ncbi:MAG: hypothetical protein JWO30_3000 [Fibrobacteres bacterium]|nr:hypothetical protein [Fibrobacterota bacterium]